MGLPASILLFQLLHAAGLALWLSVAALNNLRAFAASAGAVGATMAMTPLQQPPAIDIPLLSRAINSSLIARLALLLILGLQIAAACACWIGCYHLLAAGDLVAARTWLNLALSTAVAFLLAMHLGGLWFGYWMRQESLQITHLVMLIWMAAMFFLFNADWA